MTAKQILLTIGFLGFLMNSTMAQESTTAAPATTATSTSGSYAGVTATPDHKWELGIGVGHAMVIGDIDFKPGFGASFHVRKALDYIFSVRGEVSYMSYNGEPTKQRNDLDSYAASTISGAVHGIITANNMKWDTPFRKVNAYALIGGGAGTIESEVMVNNIAVDPFSRESNVFSFADGGVGIGFRISEKMNVGIEHKVTVPFGRAADLIDGIENIDQQRTTYRDIYHYTNFRLNFNLGSDEKSEPLYWINPLDLVLKDISELKARPVFDLTDTDGDGVIDMVDQEKDSPEGAIVNTRGETLDSDGDGVMDHEDKEPFSPPGYSYDGEGVAQVPAPDYTTKADVEMMINNALKDYDLTDKGDAMVDWFLPMIHFDLDKYSVKDSEAGKIAGVARVMKANPSIKIAVTGFTDQSAGDNYNKVLSYNRAKAVIDYMVANHGISRDRLILTYKGENETLVPKSGTNYMNRRVEFKTATDEVEMGRPEGPNAGSGSGNFSGNKKAGY